MKYIGKDPIELKRGLLLAITMMFVIGLAAVVKDEIKAYYASTNEELYMEYNTPDKWVTRGVIR